MFTEVIPLRDYVKNNNLLGKTKRLCSCYYERELFNGILTEEILEKFKDYNVLDEYEYTDVLNNILIKPVYSSKFIFTQEHKQPLNSKVKCFECFVPDLFDAVNRFRSRFSHIWEYKDFEIYKDTLDNFIEKLPRGLSRKVKRSELTRELHAKFKPKS